MATIADVARQAGVSVSTVSHVVNGTRRVAPATARAVQAVDRRASATSPTSSPGPEDRLDPVGRHRDLGDLQPLFQRHHLRHRDRMRAARHDGVPLRHRGRSRRASSRSSTALHQRRVDGIILAPERRPGAARARLSAAPRGCPACWSTARPIRPSTRSASTIARRCASSSITSPRRGHRRIGYIGGNPGFETTQERVVGYRDDAARPRPRRRRALHRHRQRHDRTRRRRGARAA